MTGFDLSDVKTKGLEILKLLKELDAEGMQSFINQIFKKVPYYWHASHKEAKKLDSMHIYLVKKKKT